MAIDMSGLAGPPDERGWAFAESFVKESPAIAESRRRAAEIGAEQLSPAVGATLQTLAKSVAARHIVEIGTGTGTAALWLIGGLAPDGQLTSIDFDGEHHRITRELLAAAGVAPLRARLITGRPSAVLPRMLDHGYDMVVIAADSADLNPMLDQSLRLLRDGGLLVLLNAFGGGKVADPAQRDPATIVRRLLVQRIGNDPRLTATLLPVGDGLLVASVDQSVETETE